MVFKEIAEFCQDHEDRFCLARPLIKTGKDQPYIAPLCEEKDCPVMERERMKEPNNE